MQEFRKLHVVDKLKYTKESQEMYEPIEKMFAKLNFAGGSLKEESQQKFKDSKDRKVRTQKWMLS